MTQPVDVDLNLQGDYVQQVGEATQATEGLNTAVNALSASSSGVQRALGAITPTRAHIAAWGGFTAAAAYFQQEMSGIRATASASGQSVRVLESDVRRLASTFPIGTAGAVQMVQAVQGLGARQRDILPLAQTFERLSAATGSFGPEMAQNFGQLNRQMASLDPGRVQRFSDVLTTLAAKSGASASGIVNFAQSIAPMAQQAGLGESAVLGISTAFVRLGADGGAAATAVSKIMSDLNRSVREGTNDMAAYAQISGMTVQAFRAMYTADPKRALQSVIGGIGRAGPNAQMQLESVGLGDVRTSRALLQLAQSGGLTQAMNTAQGAYDNGSTARAAAAAFGGLNDSLTELRSTAGQAAEALGTPFLKPLTQLVNLAKTALGPVNAVAGSNYMQHMLTGAATVGLTAMVARRFVGPLSLAAFGRQAYTSTPVASAFGGYAIRSHGGDLNSAWERGGRLPGMLGRNTQEAIEMQAYGAPYGRGFMQGVNRRVSAAGGALGDFMYTMRGGAPRGPRLGGGGGDGFHPLGALRRVGAAGITASSMAYQAYLNSVADPFVQSNTDPARRQSLLTPRTGEMFYRAGIARSQTMGGMGDAGWLAKQTRGLQASLGLIESEGRGASQALSRVTSSTIGAARAMTTFAGRAAEAGIGMGGSMARGALGLMGGPMGLLMIGGMLGYSQYESSKRDREAHAAHVSGLDMYAGLNAYRDAMGKAGEASMTLADQMSAAAAQIGQATVNMPDARRVRPQDIGAAGTPNPKRARVTYYGSDTDIAGQVQTLNLRGLQAGDVQSVKMDMLAQGIPGDRVDRILGMVNTSGSDGRFTGQDVAGIVGGVTQSSRNYSPSTMEDAKRRTGSNTFGYGGPDWSQIGGNRMGSKPLIGKQGDKLLDQLQSGIMQQYSDLSQHFQQSYAVNESVASANQALQDALKTGDPDVVAATAARVGASLTGNANYHVSAAKVRAAGGNALSMLGPKTQIYGQSVADWQRQGVGGTIAPHLIATGDYTAIQSAGPGAAAMLPYFGSTRMGGPAGAAQGSIAAFAAQPGNYHLQTQAVQDFVSSLREAGQGLGQIAAGATQAMGTTSGYQNQLMQGAYGEAQFQLQRSQIGQSMPNQLQQQLAFYAPIAATTPTDEAGAQKQADARQQMMQAQSQLVGFYQQRIMAQYQYQVQSGRAQEDFQKSTARSEEDYHKSRFRQTRDFNRSMRREMEDAAQSMYNPYERIAVHPVWDAGNLQMNRSEQLSALRTQFANINKLRSMGLSEQTINQLQLYDPNNAQQTAELVADLRGNRGLIRQYNVTSAQIQGASQALLSKSPQYQRQRQDFRQTLRDQQADFNTAASRARTDFVTQQSRMATDIHTQDMQITNNMETLQRDMNKVLHGQYVDVSGQLTNTLQDALHTAQTYAPQIAAALSGVSQGANGIGNGPQDAPPTTTGRKWTGTPTRGFTSPGPLHRQVGPSVNQGFLLSKVSHPGTDMNTYGNPNLHWGHDILVAPDNRKLTGNRKLAQTMARSYGWADGPEWAALYQIWQQESGFGTTAGNINAAYGIPQADPGTKMASAGADWRTNPSTQIRWGLKYIKGTYGDPLGAWAHKSRTGWYAQGGIFNGPQVIGVGERGPEMVLPLDDRGAKLIASAMKQYVGVDMARSIATGGMASATHIDHSRHYYDYRNDFGGATFHVQANDPAALARESAARARRDALTSPRGVAWQPT